MTGLSLVLLGAYKLAEDDWELGVFGFLLLCAGVAWLLWVTPSGDAK
ncbi:hypothetical protein LCGC14_2998650 [marine sediment metagenome]|uniref:Uncharacterized protein n=1 Tax=marine sediment metagenome TaxID=412755 RepID=A0A0F8XP99_9ZZZZ